MSICESCCGPCECRVLYGQPPPKLPDHNGLAAKLEQMRTAVADLTAEREAHAATRRELEALRERVAAEENQRETDVRQEELLATSDERDARWLAVYGAAFNTWCQKVDVTDEAVERAIEEAEALADWEREVRTKGEKR